MASRYTLDIWREIMLCLDSYQDLLALIETHSGFSQILQDANFLRTWLNGANAKVRYEFGSIGRPYAYGDWTMNFLLPQHQDLGLRFSIESLLAKGCNARAVKDNKMQRCGRRADYSSWNDVVFPFDLLKAHGWKVCKTCLDDLIIEIDDKESMAFLNIFVKVFPSVTNKRSISLRIYTYQHLGRTPAYYKISEVDNFILHESNGQFTSFATWKAGVIAKRGSTSELQISALLHSARGLALPGGPGRTQIALEIARQSIKEYEHRMNQFIIMNHPDIPRLGLAMSPDSDIRVD